ncbi:hypothetical protein IGS67_01875 [Flavimobilis sp. GY10621]|uniref:Lipoprotein n=1 Tax=Flavimobilis rhizosphaerae TaxID=2775421 RepID=A0ABR9DM79_9MICO|nr:hypothetical protein [Flavimobilis rhizosphaerae]MBD9698242.1 hypothetical protein [Flavimobilis rhizosphaerae]
MERRRRPDEGTGPRWSHGRRALAAALLSVPLVLVTAACDPDAPEPGTGVPSASTPAGTVVDGTPTAVPSDATSSEGSTGAPATDGTPTKKPPTKKPSEGLATVAPVERPRAAPVDLGDDAAAAPGLSARLVEVEDVDGTAEGPGEVAGAALRVTVELTNGTGRVVDLRGAVVNLYTGKDRLPTSLLSGPGTVALPASLGRDGTARATYVFRTDHRDGLLEVEVDIADAPSVVVFEGTR